MDFFNLFTYPVDVKEVKRQAELFSGKIKILEGLDHAKTRLQRTATLDSNTLAKCNTFVKQVNANGPNSDFYLEVCKLSLDELAFSCIAFEDRRLKSVTQYFTASDIRRYMTTSGASCSGRREIFTRLNNLSERGTLFDQVYTAAQTQCLDSDQPGGLIKDVLPKIMTGARDHQAIQSALTTIQMRYTSDSSLGRIDIKTFTILVERLNSYYLERLDSAALDVILEETREMSLPVPFWLYYHHQIRKSDAGLGKRYFMEICAYLYPLAPPRNKYVYYTHAYAQKGLLGNVFLPSFLQKIPAWERSSTTTCVRAHFSEDEVEIDVDLGEAGQELSVLDVLQNHVIAWAGSVWVETKNVTQVTIHLPREMGESITQQIYLPIT